MADDAALGVGCVGAGYWGKNLVRTFSHLPKVNLKVVCDQSEKVRQQIIEQFDNVKVVEDYLKVIDDPGIEAVVLAVPATDHYWAAKQALEAGKHVYVEKPMTMDPNEASELVFLAKKSGKVLMVGHLMEYHPAIQVLKDLVDRGELGDV